MTKPKHQREIEQIEALLAARRRGHGPARSDPAFQLAFAYLDRLDGAQRDAEERRRGERAKLQRTSEALRGQWWNR